MPLSGANLFRALVVGCMAVHVFGMYCLARMLGDRVGLALGTLVPAALFALLMMVPLAWAVGLPELPEIIARVRGQRRWRAGRCPGCDYPLEGAGIPAHRGRCPECAAVLGEPPRYDFGLRTVRRFVILALTAWLIGSVVGELWTWKDERDFSREVQDRLSSGVDEQYQRARRWPSQQGLLVYRPGEGITARDH